MDEKTAHELPRSDVLATISAISGIKNSINQLLQSNEHDIVRQVAWQLNEFIIQLCDSYGSLIKESTTLTMLQNLHSENLGYMRSLRKNERYQEISEYKKNQCEQGDSLLRGANDKLCRALIRYLNVYLNQYLKFSVFDHDCDLLHGIFALHKKIYAPTGGEQHYLSKFIPETSQYDSSLIKAMSPPCLPPALLAQQQSPGFFTSLEADFGKRALASHSIANNYSPNLPPLSDLRRMPFTTNF